MPPSVSIAQGATSATFAIATSAVSATTAVTLSASYGGVTRTTTFTVNPPAPPPVVLSSLALNRASVVGGTPATGTVALSAPAPSGGAIVSLASSNASVASVPSSVTVAAGASTATFPVTTAATKKNAVVTLSANYGGATRTVTLAVKRR